MIDYDVMVFIRYPKEPDFADDAVVLWNEGLSAIQIIKREGYDFLRKMLIDRNRNIVSEIQLIKQKGHNYKKIGQLVTDTIIGRYPT